MMKSFYRESKPRTGHRSTSRGSVVKTVVLDTAKTSKCAICLERNQDATYLNPCNHRFCFACIQKWSKKKVICPLCKQRFHSFFHMVNTKGAFCEYVLPLSDDSFPHSESRRSHTSSASQRSASPPDNGIVHDENRGTLSETEKDIYQMMRQFADSKRSSNTDVITLGKFKAHAVIQFRRALYHAGILVQKAQYPDFYQNASADYFRRNPGSFDRLIPWLKRELKVLCGNQMSLIHTLQSFILNNMTQHDLQSKEFEALLWPHLRHFTNHFLHELISFVQSPFPIKKYDWNALYECPVLPREDSDSFISSATSDDDEPSRLPDNNQTPQDEANLDDGNIESLHINSERDPSSEFGAADGTQCPNKDENALEDLSSTGTEKDGQTSDNFAQNQPDKIPSHSVPPSLLHNQALPSKKESELTGELHPVRTYSSKNIEPFEDSSNVLASGDCNASNLNHGDGAAISSKQNIPRGETTQLQQPDVCRNNSRSPSSGRCATAVSPGRKSAFKKSGSRDTGYGEEGPRSQDRGRNQQGRRQITNYVRVRDDSRPRTEEGRSRSKDASLLRRNKMVLPFRIDNTPARNISKSRSQQSHSFRKLRSKDYEYLKNSLANEPSWRYLYYKQDYERYRYEEYLRRKAGETRFYHPEMQTGSKRRPYFAPENRASVYQESLTKGWNYAERHRSSGRPKSRCGSAGLERGAYEKVSGKKRHKSHHLESGHAKGGTRYFQNYVL